MFAVALDCHPKSFSTGMAAISEIASLQFVWADESNDTRRNPLSLEDTGLSTVSETKQIFPINHLHHAVICYLTAPLPDMFGGRRCVDTRAF